MINKLLLVLGICSIPYKCNAVLVELPVYKIQLSTQNSLVFLKYNEAFNLYSAPRLNKNGILYNITGYDDINFSGVDSASIKISVNQNYLMMDDIIKGFVELPNGMITLHENYQCVIIDIEKPKVVWQSSQMCDGKWHNNSWVSNGLIQFDGR